MKGTPISISRLHFPVTTLGPGRRIGVWVQGCSIGCRGCISLDTWSTAKGWTTVEAVMQTIQGWLATADGFSISGGEPFDQASALKMLLREIRNRHPGDVLVYSGYPVESLPLPDFDGLIDALISDPLDIDADQTLPLRGSDNQRLHFLTSLGQRKFSDALLPRTDQNHALDIMFDDRTGEVFMAGIPRRGDLLRLRDALQAGGHLVATTEDERQSR